MPFKAPAVIKDEVLFSPQNTTGATITYTIPEATAKQIARLKHASSIGKENFDIHVINKCLFAHFCL